MDHLSVRTRPLRKRQSSDFGCPGCSNQCSVRTVPAKQVSGLRTILHRMAPAAGLNLELGTWNSELGIFAPECRRPRRRLSKFQVLSSKFQVQRTAGVAISVIAVRTRYQRIFCTVSP